jgi:hypothetical protein
MKKLFLAVTFLAVLVAPRAALAQNAGNGPPATGIVTISKFQVPLGEDRGKVMEFIERVTTPQERANPNVMAFYVLEHYYGADARDIAFVRVYREFADIEAPCGEACQTWAEENLPEEGTPEFDELNELGQTFMKYYSNHSDEIFSTSLSLSKN